LLWEGVPDAEIADSAYRPHLVQQPLGPDRTSGAAISDTRPHPGGVPGRELSVAPEVEVRAGIGELADPDQALDRLVRPHQAEDRLGVLVVAVPDDQFEPRHPQVTGGAAGLRLPP